VVECRVVEIDIAKMLAAGFELRSALMTSVGTSSPGALGMFSALEREGIAQVVARPQLMTLAGQPAEVRTVREVDVPVLGETGKIGKDFVGTQFWVLPRLDEQGRITMEFKLRTSEQGEPYSYKIENQPVYLVGGETSETTVTLEDGQTLITGGGYTSEVMKSKDYEKLRKAAASEGGLPPKGVARFCLLTARIVRPSSAKAPTAEGTGTIDPPRAARGLSSPTGAQPK
jgi:Flp pilus assembly secretin CpaC